MSNEELTQINDLYVRYRDAGGLELAGSLNSIRQLADCLTTGRLCIKLVTPTTVQAAPYDGFMTFIQIEVGSAALVLKRASNAFTICGSTEKLAILADNLQWLASKVTETGYDDHLHIDYYEDHSYLSAESEPLVVSVKA